MDHTRMIGLIDGLFPFGKKSKIQKNQMDSTALSEASLEKSGGAVVPVTDPLMTGVTKYLNRLPVDSSVSKYLKKQDSSPVTGVAKYMVKQAQATRETPGMTRVTKYLATIERNKPVASSVAKYMAQQVVIAQQKPAASSVVRYLLKLEKAEKELAHLTGVAKYQAEQAKVARRAEARKLIEKYKEEEAQMAIERAAAEAQIEQDAEPQVLTEATADTGVGRYVQQQDHIQSMKPPVSGVAKYLARKIVLESKKPPLSGVQKYLSKHYVYKEKPNVSSVSKYLEVQEQRAKEGPVISGVSKYITKKSLLSKGSPEKSGVAKYLLSHARAVSDKTEAKPSAVDELVSTETGVSRYITDLLSSGNVDPLSSIVEKCLEGEFIPASETSDLAVEVKDIVQPVKKNPAKKAKSTGVSKYLDERAANEKTKKASKRTGVEKYLIDIESS